MAMSLKKKPKMPPWKKSEISDKQWYVVMSQDCQILVIFTFTENQYEGRTVIWLTLNCILTFSSLHALYKISSSQELGTPPHPSYHSKKSEKVVYFLLETKTHSFAILLRKPVTCLHFKCVWYTWIALK